MLNKDVLAHDPASYRLADGGVAKVMFPPDEEQKAILREQLQTFVCEGAYADGLRRILEAFNGAAGRRGDVPAVWISGFYGSGKSLLTAMLGALWSNLEFPDGATAEGLAQGLPAEVTAGLRELRANAKRLGGLLVGGTTLGRGAQHPVKAVLGAILQANGLPSGGDLRPALVALWLDEQGILGEVRSMLAGNFGRAAEQFLLDDALAAAALAAKPSLAPDLATLMDRLGRQYEHEPEPTVAFLVETARKALMVGRKEMPLTLVILDEVQQYVRENADIALIVQTIAEELCAKFRGRLFLVGTGQAALGDVPYLDRLLTRFVIPIPLGSADINAVIRKTVLRKREDAKADIEKMLDLRAGEIDRHLQGSSLRHSAADRPTDVADWPILAPRRRFWERVLAELDRSGLFETLRGQLRISLDAVKQYGERPLGVAVPGDFLFDTFAAEALSRNLVSREIYDRIATLQALGGDGPLKARLLILVYLVGRIAGDVAVHGVHARADVLADLLIADLAEGAAIRAKVPDLLVELQTERAVIEVNGEWRLQTKESAEWQAAFNRAESQAAGEATLVPRQRSALLELAIGDALSAAASTQQGSTRTPRRIERVTGDTKPNSDGLVLRLWNGWDDPLATVLNEIKAADATKDATMHFLIPEHRGQELRNAIIAREAATATIQNQGVPATDAGKEAKAAVESLRTRAEEGAKAILSEAIEKAQVLVAGGAEVGSGLARADAVREAATRVLDRLYPEFAIADHPGWDRVVREARRHVPDCLKEVGHAGDPQDHPVCKAFLRALRPSKKGSELIAAFGGPPYGWPDEAIEAAMLTLANAGQIKITGADGKPVVAAATNATQLRKCTFTPENRVVSAGERIAVRALGLALGLNIPSGQENDRLLSIVDRLEGTAEGAGGAPPAPAVPEIPAMAAFRASAGNDLLAELAARADELKPRIAKWQAAKVEKESRLRNWELLIRLVGHGARRQESALEAIRKARSLLDEPNPLPSLLAAAADDLRREANAAHAAWRQSSEAGKARLEADPAWEKMTPEKKHALRAEHALLPEALPDLSTPEKIAESLTARHLSQWRDMTLALPARIDAALRDATLELEPKTQTIALPRRIIRSEPDLDAWLAELRDAIKPLLASGPVLPTP
ncbi:MAG: BREX system P-loop protein BrxC [Acetobacteraceae bacterium]